MEEMSHKSPGEGSIGDQKLEQEHKSKIVHCSKGKHDLLEVFSHSKFKCEVCKDKGKGKRYRCKECNVHIHTVCGELPDSLSSFTHSDHRLSLGENPLFSKNKCCLCGGAIKGMVYKCEANCQFLLHPRCSLAHKDVEAGKPSHPLHPLELRPLTESKKCDVCKKKCLPWNYQCRNCDVYIHVGCLDRGSDDRNWIGHLKNAITVAHCCYWCLSWAFFA